MLKLRRIALGLLTPLSLAAQTTQPNRSDENIPTGGAERRSEDSSTNKTLFTWRDAAIAAGFAGLTVAMFPLDQRLALDIRDSSLQANHSLKDAGRALEYITDPGSLIIGAGMYAVGRYAHLPDVEDLGLHGTEAVLLSGGLVIGIRSFAGRTRPEFTNDSNPDSFHFLKGITDRRYQSFPSGHSAAAFAAAAAVTSESQRWWPHGTWLVASTLYGGATLLGVTRMYNNEHWASDVVLGAGIGTFSGLKVVRYNHSHPDNWVNRLLLATTVAPDGFGGVRMGLKLEQ